jgi:hypothetical protein
VTTYAVSKDGAVVWKGTAISWTDQNTSAGQDTYQVQALNEAGTGPWSTPVHAILARPPAPTSVQASGGSSRTITWTSDSALVTGFRVYGVSDNGNATYLTETSASARSALDNTFVVFRSWSRYRVCAINDAGESCKEQS